MGSSMLRYDEGTNGKKERKKQRERERERKGTDRKREINKSFCLKKEQVIFLAGGGERDQIRASDRREVIPHLKNLEHAACDCG